ncbi:MAG: hypothetical protein ACRCYU_01155 [Nocardioides sp.]
MSDTTTARTLRPPVGSSPPSVARADQRAARRARLTVPERLAVPTPRFPFVTLMSMIMVGGVVGLLLVNTSMQQASFVATALAREAQTLTDREQTLQIELEDLRDPQRLAEAARAQGMVPVSRPAFLSIRDGTVLGNPAPASGADQLAIDAPPALRPTAAFPPPTTRYRPPDSSRGPRGQARDRAGAPDRTNNGNANN